MRSSVFYTITFFFLLTSTSILLSFLWLIRYDTQNYTNELNRKYTNIARIIISNFNNNTDRKLLNNQLDGYKMEKIKNNTRRDFIINSASILQKITISSGSISILLNNKNQYLLIVHNDKIMLLKDAAFQPYRHDVIKLIFFSIFLITFIAYFLTIRKLRPLRKMKNQINKFAKGDIDDITCRVKGQDEIAEVANAFDNAVSQIRKLNKSRQLFLRNIMHELKTPITKGLITAEMIPHDKNQKRLVNVFNKLEKLINEFATIERITSGVSLSNIGTYRLVDMLDEAIDIAMVERDCVDINLTKDINLNVDFKFFCIGLKNMIDNGIKYSQDNHVKILANEDEINFISKGNGLKNDLTFYLEPFTQGKNAKDSFGLGLYIVNGILKTHKIELTYRYQDGFNIFSFIHIKHLVENNHLMV